MRIPRQQLEQWDQDHLWHPFTPMKTYRESKPIIIDRAEGCWLIDLDGNRYIDGVASMWCNIHGHRVPEIDEALHAQVDKLAHSTLLGLSNAPAIELARKLAEITPGDLEHVFFSDDGATANEVALKMALQYQRQRPDPKPKKTKYLALSQAYHGDTLGDVSVGGIPHFHAMFAPLLFETVRAPHHYCYRCPLGLERSTCEIDCVIELEQLVERHHEELAAVIVEPLVQGAAGMIVAPEGYLRRVREVTAKFDVLMIADEVVTAFGRCGSMFACDQEGVVPDFLCLAKGLTAGYLPLSATLTTPEIFEAFLSDLEDDRTFYHGHTYAGNPLGAAVALANLKLIESSKLIESLPPKIEILGRFLERVRDLPHVGDVRQKGLLAGIELVEDKVTKKPFPMEKKFGAQVCQEAVRRGAWIRPLGDVLVIMPPLAIEPELLTRLCEIVEEAIPESATRRVR